MVIKKFKKYIIFFFLSLIIFVYILATSKKKDEPVEISEDKQLYSTNIIQDVSYISKDTKGNLYTINAKQGEIDLSNSSIIYLTNVNAVIKLTGKDNILITSNYGKYNIDNYDTIFNEDVIINYLDNKINGEYLDFSTSRSSMIISKDVVYTNLDNILEADVIEVDIDTKDTKIFMYDNNNKVNIKSIN